MFFLDFFHLQWGCRPPCKITCAFPDSEVISPQIHFGERGPTYYVDESPIVERVGESVSLTEINNAVSSKVYIYIYIFV